MDNLNNFLGIIASLLSIIAFVASVNSVKKVKEIEKNINTELNFKSKQSKNEVFTNRKASSGESGISVVGDSSTINGGR